MGAVGKSSWQISLRGLLIAWVFFTIAGVVGRRAYLHFYPPPPKLLCVVDGLDQITQIHLQNLLQREGVTVSMGGSKIYGCEVDAVAHDRMLRLLENAATDKRPTVLMRYPHAGAPLLVGDPRDAFDHHLDQPIKEVIQGESTELTRILLAIAQQGARSPNGVLLPIVKRVYGHRRFYLQPDGTWALGVEVTVQRASEPTSIAPRITSDTYQIYDDFRQVIRIGGSSTAEH